MAQQNVFLGQPKTDFIQNIQGNFTELYNSLSGIPEIPDQYIRIWGLEVGIYKLTYPGAKYIYYSGATNTYTVTVNTSTGECLLFVTSYGTTYQGWECHFNRSTISYIYFGYTSSSSGTYYSKNLSNIPASAVKYPAYNSSQYNIGFYYLTSNITSLNTATYLVPGEYGLSVTSTTTGMPYSLSGSRKIFLKTKSSYYSTTSTYAPTIQQDLFVTVDNRTFTRFIIYASSSNITYGDWTETTPGNLPIASSTTLGAIKVGSNLSINASGVLSATSSPTTTLYPFATIAAGSSSSTIFVAYSNYYWLVLPKQTGPTSIELQWYTSSGSSTATKSSTIGNPLWIHGYTSSTATYVFEVYENGDTYPTYIYGSGTLYATPAADVVVYAFNAYSS